jgi:hypothetical protein
MELSACFQKSGALSCISCHDPHRDAVPETAHYDAVCRRCHSNPTSDTAATSAVAHTVCPKNPRSGCTGCHMPRQQIKGIPFATYRTHWIRAY